MRSENNGESVRLLALSKIAQLVGWYDADLSFKAKGRLVVLFIAVAMASPIPFQLESFKNKLG